MKTIDGYDVKVFTDNIEDNAMEQLMRLLSIDVFSDKKIRIMPDVHAGVGCVIGFTGDLGDKVIPDIVGVDIGCGMRVLKLGNISGIDFHAFHTLSVSLPAYRPYMLLRPLTPPYSETCSSVRCTSFSGQCRDGHTGSV